MNGRRFLIVALVALAASVPGLMNDFVYDDLAIIRDNVRVHDFAHWREILTMPYWPPPFVEQLYRPLAVLLLAIEYVLGGGAPIVFRLVSYALYVGCALGVFQLSRRVLSPTAAVAVAVLFAAHPVHVEAVALGVNQGELLVGLIALAMTTLYLDGRRAGMLGLGRWAMLIMLYGLAALTKENGFIIPGLLVCAELTLVPGKTLRSRAAETLVGYMSMAAVGAGLLVLRSMVLPADAFAVVPVADLRGWSLIERTGAMLQTVPTWFRLLVFPATLSVDYHLTTVPSLAFALGALGIALLVSAIILMYRARYVAPAVAFGIAWCGVALLPVSNLVPTGVLVGERTLFLPSVGFLIAVGGAAMVLLSRYPRPILRRRLLIACAALATLGVVKSVVRQLSWNSAHVRLVGPRRGVG